MQTQELDSTTTARIAKLACDNAGATVAIRKAAGQLNLVLDQLEKYDVTGIHIWCLYLHHCSADQNAFIERVINMPERPSGICEHGHDWGPSRFAKRTQCFRDGCETEANKFCSKCYCVRYCSSNCQSTAWEDGHRERCERNVSKMKDAIKLMGLQEAIKRLYILGLISESGITRFVKKHYSIN